MKKTRNSLVLGFAVFTCISHAAAPSSRIIAMARTAKATNTLVVESVSCNHAQLSATKEKPASGGASIEVTVVVAANSTMQAEFKPGKEFGRINLVLFVTADNGRQHLRSQIQLGHPVVASYKVGEDKKTASVILKTSLALVSEEFTSANADWVTVKG